MVPRRYGISLPVFNLISHSFAGSTHLQDIKLNITREIPYLQAAMYYSLYYTNIDDNFFDDFPKISKHFLKISQDSPKVVWRPENSFQNFSENFPRFLRRTDDGQSYSYTSKYFLRDCVNIAVVIFSLLKITCYFTYEDITFMHKSLPGISLVFI